MALPSPEFNIIMSDSDQTSASENPRRPLSPAARRALAEAAERRRTPTGQSMPAEVGGRGGADPARFGDWEINGRAIDF